MTPQEIVDRDRCGQFIIEYKHLQNAPGVFQAVLKDLIIVRCELMWSQHSFHYMALGPVFEARENKLDMPPWYDYEIFQQGPNKYVIKWTKREEL